MAPSLCVSCERVRKVVTPKGSTFLLCEHARVDRRYPKYPPQPVRSCEAFRPSAANPEVGT